MTIAHFLFDARLLSFRIVHPFMSFMSVVMVVLYDETIRRSSRRIVLIEERILVLVTAFISLVSS